MNPCVPFRPPDTYARIRSLLTTLQLRLDLYAREHGADEAGSAFLDAIHHDIAHLADLVHERRLAPRAGKERNPPDVPNYLAQSS